MKRISKTKNEGRKLLKTGLLTVLAMYACLKSASGQSAINFFDVTATANISSTEASYGCSWGDINGDGLPDIYTGHHHNGLINPSLPIIYVNLGNGVFNPSVYSLQLNGNRDLHGASWADFDNDGDDDLIILTGGGFANIFYVNNGTTVLTDSASAYQIDMTLGRGRTPTWIDADNDGKLDLIICNEKRSDGLQPSTLFRQDNGVFVNENIAASFNYSNSLSFVTPADLNNSGLPEAFVVYHTQQHIHTIGSFPLGYIPFPFTQQVNDAVCADFNNDLLSEILMVRQMNASGIYIDFSNRLKSILSPPDNGEHGFSFFASDTVIFYLDLNPYQQYNIHIGLSGYSPASSTFTLVSTDSNNHGIYPHAAGTDEGIYIGFDPLSNVWSVSYCVLANNKIGIQVQSQTLSQVVPNGFVNASAFRPAYFVQNAQGFTDNGLIAGFSDSLHGASVVAGDFDNDMDLDVYIGCHNGVINEPNVLYENNGNGFFTKIPGAAGAAGSNLGRTESVTTADYDLDGFLDLLIANGEGQFLLDNAPYQLFKNAGNTNHWLEIDLQGTTSNRNGIGTKVYVTAGGVTQVREQNNGIHFGSQNFRRLHFGLGPNSIITLLEVHWPDGTIQQFSNIPSNQIIIVNQSTGLGIHQSNKPAYVTVFPNPANERIFINASSELLTGHDLHLNIFHSSGALMHSQKCSRAVNPFPVDVSNLSPGIYFIKIISEHTVAHTSLVICK
jgi:hypothetical protein